MEHASMFQGYGVYEGVGAVVSSATPTQGSSPSYLSYAALAPTSSSAIPGLVKGVARPRRPLKLRLAYKGRTQQVAVGGAAGKTVSTKMFGITPTGQPAGTATIGFEERAGIWIVAEQAQPILTEMLKAMVYYDDAKAPGSAADPVTGQANFMLGNLLGGAYAKLQEKVDAGYAVLLQKASVQTGVLKILSTKSPETIVASASGPSAPYAVVEAPEALETAAAALVGGTLIEDGYGPPGPGPVPAAASGAMPKWVVPALIGVGVLAVGALLLSRRKKS
jgi:hypothetical protein